MIILDTKSMSIFRSTFLKKFLLFYCMVHFFCCAVSNAILCIMVNQFNRFWLVIRFLATNSVNTSSKRLIIDFTQLSKCIYLIKREKSSWAFRLSHLLLFLPLTQYNMASSHLFLSRTFFCKCNLLIFFFMSLL